VVRFGRANRGGVFGVHSSLGAEADESADTAANLIANNESTEPFAITVANDYASHKVAVSLADFKSTKSFPK
jgi:hypothetical protein